MSVNMRALLATAAVIGDCSIEEASDKALVTYFECRLGLLRYHVWTAGGEYVLCNAGDYQLTDITFDTIQSVLDYINNGESCEPNGGGGVG